MATTLASIIILVICIICHVSSHSNPDIEKLDSYISSKNRGNLKNGNNWLVATQLSWEAVKNLHQWYHGEISGSRCKKNLIDALGPVGGRLIGGRIGATIGEAVSGSKIGGFIGELLGEGLGYIIGGKAVESGTEWFFDLPKDKALEKAYNYLGVHHTATNAEINKAYRRLAVKYHPDKGGSHKQLLDLNLSLDLIRLARGEKY